MDFGPRLDLELLVHSHFSSPISFSPSFSPQGFILVASFGCLAIKLDDHSVGLILQSCLGGIDVDFKVKHLLGWMFQFPVSSKNVGFLFIA